MSETIQGALIGAGSALLGVLLTLLVGIWRDYINAKRERIEHRFEVRRSLYARFIYDCDEARTWATSSSASGGRGAVITASENTAKLDAPRQALKGLELVASEATADAARTLLRQTQQYLNDLNGDWRNARSAFLSAARADLDPYQVGWLRRLLRTPNADAKPKNKAA